MIRLFLLLSLAACAAVLTSPEAVAAGSYGSHSYAAGYGSYGSVAANVAARRDARIERRLARREARQSARAARWGGSAGSHSYGSAGQHGYSQSAPEPVAEVADYCPPQAQPMTFESCPNGMCPNRRFILGGNRRNGLYN